MDYISQEINNLIKLIQNTTHKNHDIIFKDLLDEVNVLTKSNLHESEKELQVEKLFMLYRKSWLLYSTQESSNYYRSPLYNQNITLVNSGNIKYDYERVATTKVLNKRCLDNEKEIDKYEISCNFFSSGMSAMHAALSQCFIYLRKNGVNVPQIYAEEGLYFETIALLRFLNRQGGIEIVYTSFDEILENIANNKTNIVILEPVLCNMQLSVLNLNLLVDAIEKREKDNLLFILIDSSLVGWSYDISEMLQVLSSEINVVFIEIQSGLKLYQSGLEMTNVGFVKIYISKINQEEQIGFKRSAAEVSKQMGRLKKVYGSGLSLEQMNILDTLWFFDKQITKDYMDTIHKNNSYIAQKIVKNNRLFSGIYHPSLSEQSNINWANAPFIYLSFFENDDSEENMNFLQNIILYEAKKLNISLFLGTSFGFRHHRFEIYKMHNESYQSGKTRHVVRLCIGYRRGYSFEKTLYIFLHLARYKNILQLKNHYKEVVF